MARSLVGLRSTKTLAKAIVAIYVLTLSLRINNLRDLYHARNALEDALQEFTVVGSSSSSWSSGIAGAVSNKIEVHARNHGTLQLQADDRPNKATNAIDASCTSPILKDYSLSRIPGYLTECSNSSFFGHVMRDLSNRFLLSRPEHEQLTPFKTIAIVSNGAAQAWKHIQAVSDSAGSREEMIRQLGYKIRDSFLVDAMRNNHTTIIVDPNENESFKLDSREVFLLIVDPQSPGDEDGLVRQASSIIQSTTTQFVIFRIASMGDSLYGMDACDLFLREGYKLQILSSSHVFDGENPFPPNTLFKNVDQVRELLWHGNNLTEDPSTLFQTYLFATRGIELAIPSRREYLNMTGLGNDHVIDVEREGVPFRKCPTVTKNEASIEFHQDNELKISCCGYVIPTNKMDERERYQFKIGYGGESITAEVWTGHANQTVTEAACVRCSRESTTKVACTTRYLPVSPLQPLPTTKVPSNGNSISRLPNILAIEIPGLDEKVMETLPSLKKFLSTEGAGFERFPNYLSLNHDYSVLEGNEGLDIPHFWMNQGYEVFRSSTECRGNAPKARTGHLFHGTQIQDMFCFDHDHPNCLAGQTKPKLLLSATKAFMERRKYKNETWAVFLTFSEGKEETKTLVDGLDVSLTSFLSRVATKVLTPEHWSNTVVAIFSNNRKVDSILLFKPKQDKQLQTDWNKYVTPVDLHILLRDPLHVDRDAIYNGPNLHAHQLPEQRSSYEIVANDHDVMRPWNKRKNLSSDTEGPPPPSILSFYADIPKRRKVRLHMNQVKEYVKRATVGKGCQCATNLRTWFLCEEKHPWKIEDSFKEYFMLVDCPFKPMHFESRMLPNKVLLRRSKKKRDESGYTNATNVNILFLEVDSVSQQYADRHFPKTRELLKQHRMQWNKQTSAFDCPYSLCSADFANVSLVGANSIPNQIAALAGCLGSTTDQLCGLKMKDVGEICQDPAQRHFGLRLERIRFGAKHAYWCPPRDKKALKTTWLLGVMDARGYINFFGEEFCYESSPYVTQGNVFTTFYQDLESHHVFCRLAERKITKDNLNTTTESRWGVSLEGPCIEGSTCMKNTEKATISLGFIQNMWKTYPDTPKFAFLNAMAAHDYSHNWEQVTSMAERYDDHLFHFLTGILSRPDANQTVIILRSDHGLQRGPMAMDYSLQIEHRRPWTEVLVPENLIASKRALFENQKRMTTGFDLYNTIRSLLSRTKGQRDDEGMPHWSFDLLSDVIPTNRTCRDAKVDIELCRSSPVSQEYGVCNRLDKQQVAFCAK